MFCENCGTQLPDDSKFCTGCGSKVSSSGHEKTKGQRGPVPPVMRQTIPQYPTESYENLMENRQPSNYHEKETPNGQPAESYMSGAVDIISFGKYVLMIFLAGIPIINIILFVKWGFFSKEKPNRKNFARALLFYYFIAVIIYIAYVWLWLKATSSI